MNPEEIPSATFCILPWIHWHIPTDSLVKPCCRANYELPMGDLKKHNILEIWNNDRYKQLRKNMLAGKFSPECVDCDLQEKINQPSFRQAANKDFKEHAGIVEHTSEDGYLNKTEIRFLDISFGNKCNFKCRNCSPANSSLVAYEYDKLFYPVEQKILVPSYALENAIQMIPYLRRINFAGGEPLLHDDHYLLLEKLIKSNHTNIELCYETNFSNLNYKQWNVLKLWNFFSDVLVVASLDDIGVRGEFLRKGLKWKEFVKNAKLLKIFSPRVGFRINITVNIFNVLYLEETVESLLEEGLITTSDDVSFNFLTRPLGMNAQFLKGRIPPNSFKGVQAFIEKSSIDFEAGKSEFLRLNNALDNARHESWEEHFPKLAKVLR